MDGIITADEFWATHAQQFFDSQRSATIAQDTGVSSGFLVCRSRSFSNRKRHHPLVHRSHLIVLVYFAVGNPPRNGRSERSSL
jgi:hypothetical protein